MLVCRVLYAEDPAGLAEMVNELTDVLQSHSGFRMEGAARTLLMRLAYKSSPGRLARAAARSLRHSLKRHGAEGRAHELQAVAYVAAKFYWPNRALPILRQALDAAMAIHDLDLEHLIRTGLGAVCRQLGRFEDLPH